MNYFFWFDYFSPFVWFLFFDAHNWHSKYLIRNFCAQLFMLIFFHYNTTAQQISKNCYDRYQKNISQTAVMPAIYSMRFSWEAPARGTVRKFATIETVNFPCFTKQSICSDPRRRHTLCLHVHVCVFALAREGGRNENKTNLCFPAARGL